MEFAFRREVLVEARIRAGLSHAEVAERADVSERAVRTLEDGTVRRPYPRTIKKIADALGVPLDNVYDFTEVAS